MQYVTISPTANFELPNVCTDYHSNEKWNGIYSLMCTFTKACKLKH